MKKLIPFCCAALAFAPMGAAWASPKTPDAMTGSYWLQMENGYQRAITLDPSGNAFQVSDQAAYHNFTTGLGTWQADSDNRARITIVDFNTNGEAGNRAGSSVVNYDLNFDDLVAGQYQSVTGNISGQQFSKGDNPFKPAQDPIRTFGYSFSGQSISVTDHKEAETAS
ncbi:MAG: hypothetical protein AAF530_08455 [Pseudomonadota bacterium]